MVVWRDCGNACSDCKDRFVERCFIALPLPPQARMGWLSRITSGSSSFVCIEERRGERVPWAPDNRMAQEGGLLRRGIMTSNYAAAVAKP